MTNDLKKAVLYKISLKTKEIQRRRPDLKLPCDDFVTAAYVTKEFNQDDDARAPWPKT